MIREMEGFRDLSFRELTLGRVAADLPLRFRLPATFVAVPSDGDVRMWWMVDDDAAAWDGDDPPRDGLITVTISMNVGYDPFRGLFFGGGPDDGDETTMAAEFERAGVEDVSVERYDVNRIPVLFVEGQQDDHRIAMCYIATLIDTNVVFLFYSHPTPYREVDRFRWMEMKRAILASGEAVRVAR